MLRPTVSRPVYLGVKQNLGPKTRFLLPSDSCWFVRVRRPVWREDGSVFYNCCWSSPAQSCLQPMNSSGQFASWVLMQLLWWPLFCLLLQLRAAEAATVAVCCALHPREGYTWGGVAGREHPSRCSLGPSLQCPLSCLFLGVSVASIVGGMRFVSVHQQALAACRYWCCIAPFRAFLV
jgi:hypothetical protein